MRELFKFVFTLSSMHPTDDAPSTHVYWLHPQVCTTLYNRKLRDEYRRLGRPEHFLAQLRIVHRVPSLEVAQQTPGKSRTTVTLQVVTTARCIVRIISDPSHLK